LMLHSVEQFAEGDLTGRLTATNNDDISRLFHGYNHALQRMSDMIEKIIESVNSTAAASRRIMEGAETMAHGIQKQANDTTMIAAAVEEMASTISDNSSQAHLAVEEARSAVHQATQGGTVVQQTIQRINSIASVVQESAATIERLGDSTTEIRSAAQMIEEIADQTNLLALNAAIEAARAGDQGRGFAVVADEVRKLAERTQDATHQIAAIIKRIQKDSQSAVAAMNQGTKVVATGQKEAEQAAQALQDILVRVEGMSQRISTMARSSEELASTAQSIAQTVDTIRDVAETAAATTTEIANDAEHLYSMTEHLHELTEQFHVESQQRQLQ
ncbi:MAG: methyl-accepting chemotaxis protein, partial [Candidatus Kapaibacterium sp.]